ncbi:hypothetical protein XYCOK13_39780 [Xylanibacillus composti]|uniref:Uncharacterized protein n=1 Tax=Xylanibacillus composti TaxID=1572762 RepID=A0A8J4H8P3_9BACL|nr:hypothetical protein XYCOK13_39780 [Xylanibacillus composti]
MGRHSEVSAEAASDYCRGNKDNLRLACMNELIYHKDKERDRLAVRSLSSPHKRRAEQVY